MKSKYAVLTGLAIFAGSNSFAYPLISTYAESANGRVIFYQDHQNANKYWYFSNVIDPVETLDGRNPQPVVKPNYFYFAYSGQAQVRKSDLESFATAKGIDVFSLTPMPIERTDMTACQNMDSQKVSIQIPPRVPAFLEHLPVTVSTRDPEAIEVLKEAMDNGSGVNCFANIQYKVAADQHTIAYEVAMDDIFSQFQAAAYARWWFFEVDIRTNLKSYAKNGWIKVTEFKDGDLSNPQVLDPNDTKKSTEDMFMAVFDMVIKQLFNRVTKIPEDIPLPGPGKGALFSLRTSYTRSSERFSFKGQYSMQATRLHESLIQIRVAPKKQQQ